MKTNKLNTYLLSGLMLIGGNACKQASKTENMANKAATTLMAKNGKELNIELLERYTNGKIVCKNKQDSVEYFSKINDIADTFESKMDALETRTESIVYGSENKYNNVIDSLSGGDPTFEKIDSKYDYDGATGKPTAAEEKLMKKIEAKREAIRQTAEKEQRETETQAWEKRSSTRDSLYTNLNKLIEKVKQKYAQK